MNSAHSFAVIPWARRALILGSVSFCLLSPTSAQGQFTNVVIGPQNLYFGQGDTDVTNDPLHFQIDGWASEDADWSNGPYGYVEVPIQFRLASPGYLKVSVRIDSLSRVHSNVSPYQGSVSACLDNWFCAGILEQHGFPPEDPVPEVTAYANASQDYVLRARFLTYNALMTGAVNVGLFPGNRLLGDQNSDGRVNAADYVVWRKTDGSSGGYSTWRANFGASIGSASGRTIIEAVPEPETLTILIFMSLVGGPMSRWRRSQLTNGSR
jgi:hypothetical protein